MRRILLAMLLLTLSACNLSTASQPTATPAATQAPPEQPALTTYTNTAFAYSIEVPSGITITGPANSIDVWIDRQIYITASEYDPEHIEGDRPIIEQATDAMVGAHTARRLGGYYGVVGGFTPQRYESLVIRHIDLYYMFIAFELKKDDVQPIDRTMNPVPPETLALLDQIVASLRFTA